MEKPQLGQVLWQDLTVQDAEGIARFYQQVVGWTPKPVPMGEYEDFGMMSGETMTAGVCHARGANAALPPQWLLYVAVADLEASLAHCEALGGERVAGPNAMGADHFAVIRDPAGAVLALYQSGAQNS
ncbi:VOC family protein [Ferrimonas balearica]|uniref:VOC family protein n=1 Tax=Ferrimonas balearica TaxID=44012 RepID=UPI001C9A00F8|nr:VOC family protein [Ferrimonas balearica]MBY5991247.1 VOC family protein [Ferrimonas balearica]